MTQIREATHPAFIEALLDPAAHPHATGDLRVEETHISWLIFTDDHVYKVKKPVNFGFLDFSTLDRREHFCREELRLNQRLSPNVYLGVEPVTLDGGRYLLGGDGQVIDYALKMRRLPESGWLAGLLKRDQVDAPMVRRIAARIADFHAQAAEPSAAAEGSSLDIVSQNTEENFNQTAPFLGWTLPQTTYDVVRAYSRTFLHTGRSLFLRREEERRIRDGHGDLHAGQICVENGIDFIDCIEFNDRFRIGDTAADLAFLAMDLDARGHPELSRVLVEEYRTRTNDEGLEDVLRFYKCYRAYTRGKVESMRADQLDTHRPERRAAEAAARRYFQLARHYAIPKGPLLIALTGLMGTGKSSVAEALSMCWDAMTMNSDVVRKELAGVPAGNHRYVAWQQGIYAEKTSEATYTEMHRRAAQVLTEGGVVVLDGSYAKNRWREAASRTAEMADAQFVLVEVHCPPAIVRDRLLRREASGEGASDGRIELASRQAAEYEPVDTKAFPTFSRIRTDQNGEELPYHALRAVYGALPWQVLAHRPLSAGA